MSDEYDVEVIERCVGLFVGQLSEGEMTAFNRLCRDGKAARAYSNDGAWLLGLAKVSLTSAAYTQEGTSQ